MNEKLFNELLSSVQQAGQIMRNEINPSRQYDFNKPNVQSIRKKIGFSQQKFAELIGVSKRTLQNWEQGAREPTGSAKVLLKLVYSDPEMVLKNLHQ